MRALCRALNLRGAPARAAESPDRNGTIGDITILKSFRTEFAQAAIAAVKQWRYSPLAYEGVLTVTVNFTLP